MPELSCSLCWWYYFKKRKIPPLRYQFNGYEFKELMLKINNQYICIINSDLEDQILFKKKGNIIRPDYSNIDDERSSFEDSSDSASDESKKRNKISKEICSKTHNVVYYKMIEQFIRIEFKKIQYYDMSTSKWLYLHENYLLSTVINNFLDKRKTQQSFKFLLVKYTKLEIQNATNSFSKSNLIAEGGYGLVYKGHLRYIDVAIKVMKPVSGLIESFFQELNILYLIRHPYIIQLLGACLENYEQPVLVFEYMNNQSLQDHIRNHKVFSIDYILDCLLHVSQAVAYLHSYTPPIIHGDIKPANILFDKNMNAKLADVGIARILPSYKTRIKAGTKGYLPPEDDLSPKIDTYSLGIVILQILYWDLRVSFPNEINEECAIKKSTSNKEQEQIWKHLKNLAIICINANAHERPTVVDIIHYLERIKTKK